MGELKQGTYTPFKADGQAELQSIVDGKFPLESAASARSALALCSAAGHIGQHVYLLTENLKEAANASDKHARALVRATWVLAFSTVGLLAATVALVWVTFPRAP